MITLPLTDPSALLSGIAALSTPAVDALHLLGNVHLLGYVGPGAGLSMIGSLLAVVVVLLLALLGPLLYPLRLFHGWLRRRRQQRASFESNGLATDTGEIPTQP